jgi:hypothetical protein
MAIDSLTGDMFVQALQRLGEFTGTAAALMELVVKPEKPPRGWPANARAATQLLRRQAPVMRKAGWHAEDDGGRNHDKIAIWTIRPPRPEIARNSSPQDPQAPQKKYKQHHSISKQAGQAGHKNGSSHVCQHCRLNGPDVVECAIGGETVRLHRDCITAWNGESVQ